MIIGICGVAGAGKDTAADHLVRAHQATKLGLADPLKRYCYDAYGFSADQLWGPSSARSRPDERYPREHTFMSKGGLDECLCCGFIWRNRAAEPPQCYLTPRYALQICGTAFGRHCFLDTWANKAVKVAQELLESQTQYVVISDVRFRNELRIIRQAGGKIWRIVSAESNSEAWRSHASESEQTEIEDSEFDTVVVNNKAAGKEAFFADIDRALDIAIKKP